MATDATGTPTALGIPKFDTSVDAPSGLGFNAAMDVIDTLITAANKLPVKKGGTLIGTRRNLNLIQGSNVTLTVADNAGSDAVDVTIAAASTGDPAVGGDLSGTASNAQIVANAVGSTELADNAVDTNAIQANAVTEAKIATKFQYGTVTLTTDASQIGSFNFGSAFPTACDAVVLQDADDDHADIHFQVQSKSASSVTFKTPNISGSQGVTLFYIAIGH